MDKKSIQRIICGNNLEALQKLPSDFIDLEYDDPPFFTNHHYEVIWGDNAEIRQFEDRWVKMGEKGKYGKDMNTYLEFMEPRIRELHRVLKPTGLFYLHCDYHANAYLRILCDNIFGYSHLLNEIIWRYRRWTSVKKAFQRMHDTILVYRKGKNYTYNLQYEPFSEKTAIAKYERKVIDGRSVQNKNKLMTRDARLGVAMHDVWDIPFIHPMAKERLGYPTQKPEALLERIIRASSNEGDLVLDAFCGCGTTIAVAKKLKRQFIGIDVSTTACRIIAKRSGMAFKEIEGLPLSTEEIDKLTGWEFQNWILREFGAIVGKRGPDGGIDGKYNGFPIQVKKFKMGRADLDKFIGVLNRENTKSGICVALDFSADFLIEVARLKRENEIIIKHLNVQEILEGKQQELYLTNLTRKIKTETEENGEDDIDIDTMPEL